jgi:uncharacterized Zn-binding protein involved in type VI secretion
MRNTYPFVLIMSVLLVTGCGTVTAAPSATRSAGTLPASGQPAGTPQQRAVAGARAVLGEFVPPPGAVRLATRPKLPSGSATMGLNSTTQVDAVGYWRVSGTATALQAWEKAHISRSFSGQDVIVGPPDWNTVYTLPAVPGVLPVREMNAQFYDVGGGMSVIMADAMVSWQPPRPAAEVIGASVTAVTIAQAGQPTQGSPAPVTVTSAPVVRRLAALVNGLPVATVGDDVPCPSGGPGLTLTFRATAGGSAVAAPAACGALTLRLNGKDEPALQPPGTYNATILKIAGLHWTLG